MDASYRSRNAAARARLAALVTGLSEAGLDRPLGGGWTVKAALAHLAFWDRFAAATIERWQHEGFAPTGDDDGALINAAALDGWLALPPAYVLRAILTAAEQADRAAASIDARLLAEIVAAGEMWAIERGVHRSEHIEQIERALSATR